jgi:hypothetical protein
MSQDEDIRDLAEGLQDMLAFANACSDLRQIKGATDVIKEMSQAVLEAASLIDEYTRLPFAGRFIYYVRLGPSVDIILRFLSRKNPSLHLISGPPAAYPNL